MDTGRKEEKYDLRKLRQELGAAPFKYEYPTVVKTNPSSQLQPPNASSSSAPSVQGQRRSTDTRRTSSLSARRNSRQEEGESALDADFEERLSNASANEGLSASATMERLSDRVVGEEVDEQEAVTRFFHAFRELYTGAKTIYSTSGRQSKSMRWLESTVKDLQQAAERRQDEIAHLSAKSKEFEQQLMVIRLSDSMAKFKGQDPSALEGAMGGAMSLLSPAGSLLSGSMMKKKKETKVREQDLKEVVSKFEHQIADIHADLSKKQATMDRQSFQIHNLKEKIDAADQREEVKDLKKTIELHRADIKLLQSQVSDILKDQRLDQLTESFHHLTNRVDGIQTKMNAWFTDLSAQFGSLREEIAQHKNMIYERLYERVREDIARQTNRCFKELKTLSDHVGQKFSEYDEDLVFFREEVPKKINRTDLVSGMSEAEANRASENFRTHLIGEILNELQDSLDTINNSSNSGGEMSSVIADLQILPKRGRDRPSTTSSIVRPSSVATTATGQNFGPTTDNSIDPEDLNQTSAQQSDASTALPPGAEGASHGASEPVAADPSPHNYQATSIISPATPLHEDGTADASRKPKSRSSMRPSSVGSTVLQRGGSSSELRISRPASSVGFSVTDAATTLVANTPSELTSQDVRGQNSAQVASHLQSVLTKFYGVGEMDTTDQLRTLLNTLIQKIHKLHTVTSLKMFRHEARVELEKRIQSSTFEQVVNSLVHQLRHHKLDISLDLSEFGIGYKQGKGGKGGRGKGAKSPGSTAVIANVSATTPGGRKFSQSPTMGLSTNAR
eukprot:TRINITY_DN8743_c0_g4_i3.p1 TRINITY_DN8743_c0_g4~~TRINITY_DN8743_c0_g4_i3.p1  ORF type:complete len:791 (-),score=170.39 TRINITY_DN8743_c0_g4_i3:516-2888(-)